MHHQRVVEWRRPEGRPTIGMLAYRPAHDDDPQARSLVVPLEFGVTIMRLPPAAISAGEFFSTPRGILSAEQQRTLERWLRQELAEG
ncbi:hypothetical protein ACWCYZ_40030 [Streptomyces virginiae]